MNASVLGAQAGIFDNFLGVDCLDALEADMDQVPHAPFDPSSLRLNIHPWQWRMKRLLDVSISLIGLVFLSPVFILLAILIRLDSQGGALLCQQRIGLNGKPFTMYKFRSMHTNAEALWEELLTQNQVESEQGNKVFFKIYDDPRVTRIGKYLRKFSLDELPQLFNVLKGDMTLVGPRPPLQREVDNYAPWHFQRFNTVPGLTGLWQVNGRSHVWDFDRVVLWDLTYIRSWSFLLDVRILVKTIPVVLLGKGAY
jgi:lipopolysaccharide/colanic/teichoic acid biosynthesis glycosyltransferase